MVGKESGDFYFLLNKDVGNKDSMNKTNERRTNEKAVVSFMHVKVNRKEYMMWHRILGHPSFITLKKIISK